MKDINITLQIVTLVVLIGGIYILDKAGNDREDQMLVWLEDAEKEREAQLERISSMEIFLFKYTPYKQYK